MKFAPTHLYPKETAFLENDFVWRQSAKQWGVPRPSPPSYPATGSWENGLNDGNTFDSEAFRWQKVQIHRGIRLFEFLLRGMVDHGYPGRPLRDRDFFFA